jgi:hypothetical protein
MPGHYPEERIQHSERGERLKSRTALLVLKVFNVATLKTVPISFKETFTSKV